jgi:hypothetical protein
VIYEFLTLQSRTHSKRFCTIGHPRGLQLPGAESAFLIKVFAASDDMNLVLSDIVVVDKNIACHDRNTYEIKNPKLWFSSLTFLGQTTKERAW